MSFTTRCPVCATVFRIVSDQLKISDGWVRCGHCGHVFDASVQLRLPGKEATRSGVATTIDTDIVSEQGMPPPQPVVELINPLPAAQPDPPDEPPPAQETLAQHIEAMLSPSNPPPQPAPDRSAPPVDDAFPWRSEFDTVEQLEWPPSPQPVKEPVETSAPSREPEVLPAAAAQVATPPLTAPPSAGPFPTVPLPARPAGDDGARVEPGFVRQARRQAFWRSPAVRAGLILSSLLLVLLLGGQWAVYQRDLLAASHPTLAPWLERLCRPLGCDIQPLRRIDAIAIDSTTLVRRLGNFYAFDIVLKNTADTALAMPALELTLTQTGDEVLARRVFLADELPNAPALLPARGSVALSLRLSMTLAEERPMAGYRALVFYP